MRQAIGELSARRRARAFALLVLISAIRALLLVGAGLAARWIVYPVTPLSVLTSEIGTALSFALPAVVVQLGLNVLTRALATV